MDTLLAYDIVLLPTMQQAIAWRKEAAAACADASFGCEVTTFAAWTADLWGLYGDGRAPVSTLMRSLLFRCDDVVKEDDRARRRAIADAGAACVREASGLAAFEAAVAHDSGSLAFEEGQVLEAVRAYYKRLERAGLVEPGQALAALPAALPRRPLRVLMTGCPPLTPQQQAFFDACDWMELDERPAAGGEGPVRAPDGVAVRFAFPSGAYAWPAMLADIVREELACMAGEGSQEGAALDGAGCAQGTAGAAVGAGCSGERAVSGGVGGSGCAGDAAGQGLSARVVVAAKEPVKLYDQLSGPLSREGVTVALRGRRAFADTDFGRAFFSLARFFGYDPVLGVIDAGKVFESPAYPGISQKNIESWSRSDLADFMLSPLSGIKRKKAYEFDAKFRADRTLTRDAVCAELCGESRMFALVERIFTDMADLEAADDLVARVRRGVGGFSEAWMSEQLGCANAVRDVLRAAGSLGLGLDACLQELEHVVVDVARTVAPKVHGASDASGDGDCGASEGAAFASDPIPDLLICDQLVASALQSGSCEVAIAADLTSDAYPAAEKEDATRTLLGKLGVPRVDTSLARMRRAFFALEHLPQRRLVLERCLNDADANPLYPSVVLEEFVDCYRPDPTDLDDIDNPYSLPEQQQEGMRTRGEDALFANHSFGAQKQEIVASIECPRLGAISDENRKLVVLPRVIKGQVVEQPCLSPSQIESYLECPYKWFADRRLRLEDLDEGFGPLEMGDFAHNALCSFYRHFREDTGLAKVTSDTLEQARAIMSDVLKRHAALQPNLRVRENRLIATRELEKRQVKELCDKLMSYLDYEVGLLPDFHPEHLEYAVAGEGVVDYAGQKLIGTADRIDVDDEGRCVVIDYKGSLSDSYSLDAREEGYLGKVQSLIYAQVVRRTLGYNPVGAIYVCYGRRKFAAGAYDGHVLGDAQVPGSKPKKCSWPLAADAPADAKFTDLLDETEEAIGAALERMLAGDVAPRPACDAACKWCPVTSCRERRC